MKRAPVLLTSLLLMATIFCCLPFTVQAYSIIGCPADANNCNACHLNAAIVGDTRVFTDGSAWHDNHKGYASGCATCHSGTGKCANKAPVEMKNCKQCHQDGLPCFWAQNHDTAIPARGTSCIQCHSTCAPATTTTTSVLPTTTTTSINADLVVAKPNGGESWNRNAQRVITWNASGCQGTLKFTLWQNNGLIGTIADNVDPALGSYAWAVGNYIGSTAPLGTGYTIKIEDNGSSLADESDAPFSIVKISVKAPNGGESWQIGTTQNITWVSQFITGNLRMVLFKNGVKVGTIVDSISPALGTYTWTVGNYVGGTATAGTGYQVQMREIGTDAGDRSNANFTLTAP